MLIDEIMKLTPESSLDDYYEAKAAIKKAYQDFWEKSKSFDMMLNQSKVVIDNAINHLRKCISHCDNARQIIIKIEGSK